MALERVIINANEPVDHRNIPIFIFYHDDLGRFLPTTLKAKELNRARFLCTLAEHPLPIAPDLKSRFESAVDQHGSA